MKRGSKKIFGPSAGKPGGSKNCPKRSFFGFKNVKNLESGIQNFLSQKKIIAPMRSKMHFALKSIFSMEKTETLFFKKLENFSYYRKFTKLFLTPKNKNKKRFFCRHLPRLGMFGAFGDFGALFLIRKMKNTPKKWVCAVSRRSRRGQITFPQHWLKFLFPPQPVSQNLAQFWHCW